MYLKQLKMNEIHGHSSEFMDAVSINVITNKTMWTRENTVIT